MNYFWFALGFCLAVKGVVGDIANTNFWPHFTDTLHIIVGFWMIFSSIETLIDKKIESDKLKELEAEIQSKILEKRKNEAI
jgi:hypothetical protein